MLQKLRDRTQGAGFKIIVFLLVIALAFFGFGAFNVFAPGDPEIASVNGEEITRGMLEVEAERERRRQLMQSAEGETPDIDPLALQGMALERLISRALLEQAVDDLDLEVSRAQTDRAIVENPNFQVEGEFNENLYRRGVQALGFTPAAYQEAMSSQLALEQLQNALASTAAPTRWETRLLGRLLNQRRDIAYLPFTVERFSRIVSATDAEIEAYYQDHQAQLMTEEAADAAYLELAWEQLVEDPSIEVTEQDLLAQYEADKADAASGEQRRSSHILLAVDETRSDEQALAELADFRARIEAGESFEELARAHSEDPGSAESGGDLGQVGKGIFVPEFEQALWALGEPGELSEPVKTQFGYHLIRLDGVEMESYPAFEEARGTIEVRLRADAAQALFRERLRELDNLAFELPDSLDGIASQLGLEPQRAERVTRTAGPGPFADASLREALFQPDVLNAGNNTPALEYQEGRAVVGRIIERYPAALKPLDELRADIEAQLIEQEARRLLTDSRNVALGLLRKGEGAGQVADNYGLEWQTLELVERTGDDAPAAVLAAAFELPRPVEGGRSLGEASLGEEGEAIVTVTRVQEGDLSSLSETELEGLRSYAEARRGSLDFTALQRAMEANADIERPD